MPLSLLDCEFTQRYLALNEGSGQCRYLFGAKEENQLQRANKFAACSKILAKPADSTCLSVDKSTALLFERIQVQFGYRTI